MFNIVQQIKKLKSKIEETGIYKISEGQALDGVLSVDSIINLTDSINNYDFLICASGGISAGTYIHTICLPFASQFASNKKTRCASWRENDILSIKTFDGKIIFLIESEKRFKVKEKTGLDDLRAVYGVKL